jgi:hypothetical protein
MTMLGSPKIAVAIPVATTILLAYLYMRHFL